MPPLLHPFEKAQVDFNSKGASDIELLTKSAPTILDGQQKLAVAIVGIALP